MRLDAPEVLPGAPEKIRNMTNLSTIESIYALHIFFSHSKDAQGVQVQGARWRSRKVPSFA